ncbi:MAG: hypothetical protein ACOC3V_04815 [bacterium]
MSKDKYFNEKLSKEIKDSKKKITKKKNIKKKTRKKKFSKKKIIKKKDSKEEIIKEIKEKIKSKDIDIGFVPEVKIKKEFSLTENPSEISRNLDLESQIANVPIKKDKEEDLSYGIKGNYGVDEPKDVNYKEPEKYQEITSPEITSLSEIRRKTREHKNIETSFTEKPHLIGEGKLDSGSKREDYIISGQSWEEGKKSQQEKIRDEYQI